MEEAGDREPRGASSRSVGGDGEARRGVSAARAALVRPWRAQHLRPRLIVIPVAVGIRILRIWDACTVPQKKPSMLLAATDVPFNLPREVRCTAELGM